MRLIGLEKDWDQTRYWIVTKTKAPDSPQYQEMLSDVLERDRVMAEQVGKEIIEKGEKGLVFVGRGHDFTHYEFPADVNFGREIMGNLLWKEYGDRVFQVWPSIGMLSFVEGILEDRSGDAPVGFDLFASPFAKVLSPAAFPDAPGVPLERLARGYIYFGPRSELHNNTSIEGYVTDEMFSKHRRYYEIDFGRPFRDGAEVDAYLQAHRWPQP